MDRRGVTLGAWAGPIGILLFGTGIGPLVANFLPPLAPTLSPEEVAAAYSDNANGVRIGAILMLFAACALMAFFATISAQLRRIEDRASPYAYTQLTAGVFANLPFVVVSILWCVAAYRPDRPADDMVLLNDIGWILLVMPAPLGVIQLLPIALAILSDRNQPPLFPRWLGYFNIWVLILFLPGVLVPFFLTGPFSWKGLLAFWLPAIVFTIWLCVMCWALLKTRARTDI